MKQSQLGVIDQFSDTGSCNRLVSGRILIGGMFLEIIGIWRRQLDRSKRFHSEPEVKRTAILTSKQKHLWTFIVLFEQTPPGISFRWTGPGLWLSPSELVDQIIEDVRQNGFKFLDSISSVVLYSWQQLERDGMAQLFSWVYPPMVGNIDFDRSDDYGPERLSN